jgi:O-antigen/teichoic acid export membrane protein
MQAVCRSSLWIDSTRAILKKDIISYGLLTAVARGLQFLMLPLLTRLFSPAEYGLIDLMATLTGLVVIFVSLSLESAVARMWHETQDQSHRKLLMTSVIVIVSAFGTVTFLAFLIAFSAITKLNNFGPILPLVVGTALLLSISSVSQMVLRIERRIFKFGILQVANTAIGITFSLILILHFGMGIIGLFLANLVAAVLVLGLSIYWTRQYLDSRISRPAIEECLKYSLPLVPAVFLGWSNSQVDRLILVTLLGLGVLGVYGAAAKVAMIIAVFVEVFRLAWLPIALSHISQTSRNSFFRNSLIGYLCVLTSIGLLLTAYSREILTLLTTGDYAKGYVVIPWLVGAQIFLGSASITNVGMMISKKTAGNSFAAALGTVVNVALCLILVADFGISGAAIGSFVAAIVLTSLLLWFSLRQVDIPFDIRHAMGILSIFFITSACILFSYEYITNHSMLARTVLLVVALIIAARYSIRSMNKLQ